MRKAPSKKFRNDSDSDSSSSSYQNSSQTPQDLYRQLKNGLIQNDRYTQKIIYNISKNYKQNIGVLRISLPQTFTFNEIDIQQFFRRFGKIQNIILKQHRKNLSDQLPTNNGNSKQQSIAYVIYSEYFSALLALKILNSIDQKQRIITAKLCYSATKNDQQLFSEPLIGSSRIQSLIIECQQDYQFGQATKKFKYVGVIGLDLNDRNFYLKERILGVSGCNFVRAHYICEKMFKFEHQNQQSHLDDLSLRLVVNKTTQTEREILVMSQSLQKYNHAMKLMHELLQQIIQQYKNSREKTMQIIPKDIHIKRWQKFNLQSQLKFLTS